MLHVLGAEVLVLGPTAVRVGYRGRGMTRPAEATCSAVSVRSDHGERQEPESCRRVSWVACVFICS